MNRAFAVLKGLAPYIFQAVCVLIIAFFSLKLTSVDLRVPFNYTGDSVVILMFIKGMLLNGWTFTIPQLSAPFGMSAAAFPVMTNFDWLIMKAISVFTSEVGLVLNVFWLLTLVFSAITSAVAMRLMGTSKAFAWAAGVLYAYLPFTLLRNVAHLNLVYYLVPLIGMLAVHLASGLRSKNDAAIRRLAYIACAAQGLNYVYYSFFAILLLTFAGSVGYLSTRSMRVFKVAAKAIAVVVVFTSISLSPSLYSWGSAGKPPEMNYKYPAEAEIYGAKIRRLVAPHPQNAIPGLRQWGKRDVENSYPNENENVTSRLGLAASIGFIILLLNSLRIYREANCAKETSLDAVAPLSLFTLLIITVGGLGAVFNIFFFSDIRAYNRFSVFLAYFALLALGLVAEARLPAARKGRYLVYSVLFILFSISLYDQLLDRIGLINGRRSDVERFHSERHAAEQVRLLFPRGASFLQLPLTGFPPLSTHESMQSYDHLRPFLWSGENMKWSWPSFSQRHRGWQERLQSERPQGLVEAAVLSGFTAVWVDRYGYADGASRLTSTLEESGAVVRSNLPRYVILDLAEAKRRLVEKIGEEEFFKRQQDWLTPVRVQWGEGFYGPETTPDGTRFRWSSARGSLNLFNDSQRLRRVSLNFDVKPGNPGNVVINSGDEHLRVAVQGDAKHTELNFDLLPNTEKKISFVADAPQVSAPADPRTLYFMVSDFKIHARDVVLKEERK